MAAPTAPTSTSLVAEAFNKVGIENPGSTSITRAQGEWIEEIKNDIWNEVGRTGGTRLKSLQAVDIQVTIEGQSKYATPSDFDDEILLEILSGSVTGTAQAGATDTITLASTEGSDDSTLNGRHILITGGTAKNDMRQITTYATATNIATCDTLSSWSSTPDSTSTYLVVSSADQLDENTSLSMGGLGGTTFSKGKPAEYMKVIEDVNEYFIFDVPSDTVYGLYTRYYQNIHTIDTDDTSGSLMSKLYQNWHNVFVYGLAWKISESEDDNRYVVTRKEYETVRDSTIEKEMPFSGEWEGFEL